MSVKHVYRYYKQVSEQYYESLSNLKDMEKEVNENMVSPEQLEQMKKTVEPIKNNYMTLSWIMHLLGQPNKQSKIKTYQRKNKTFLSTLDKNRDKENVLRENKEALNKLKNTRF